MDTTSAPRLRPTMTLEGRAREVLTPAALEFLAELESRFGPRRRDLLELRAERHRLLAAGESLDFLEETRSLREGDWKVATAPPTLQNRRVEITGPVDRKMMINAFNSGAQGFMADFEDALSPTWSNVVDGQVNLIDAVAGRLDFEAADGRGYQVDEQRANLLVRPRGLHLAERHLQLDDSPISASFVDFGLFAFHNGKRLLAAGAGPFFYLPKMESHLEARLWADVFKFSEDRLELPRGLIRATVLIETVPAAFEMDEILFELREHSAGLNAGRWDYIFSMIKCFRTSPLFLQPDRGAVNMTVPFMRAYTELLVATCHRRGAHAIGGMAAVIPSRADPEASRRAMDAVAVDKRREAEAGFDGTWVAHPDVVATAAAEFDRIIGSRPNQVERLREDVEVSAADLLDVGATPGERTEAGLRNNVNVAIQYIAAWLGGTGAVGIHGLMEDAATAEISRAQVWQWLHAGARLADGEVVTRELVERIVAEEIAAVEKTGAGQPAPPDLDGAREVFEAVALGDGFPEFLTLVAEARLE